MKLNRRQFIKSTIAGAGGIVLGQAMAAETARSTDPFQKATWGKTGIQTSLLGAGTGMRGGNRQSNMTRLGKEQFETLLNKEFERGVRYFDLADLYGSHPYLAAAFKTLPRDQYVIGTKMWVMPGGIPEKERPDANFVIDRFRKELNTDYIDLVQIHCMGNPQWSDQQKRQMDILEELKSKKIIRAHGVSIHSLSALKACVDNPWVDVVHVRINAFGDSMDDKDPAVVVPVIKQLHAAGKGLIGMKLIGEGRYRNSPEKINESLKFVLSLNSIDTLIVGFEKIEELDDYAKRVKAALATM